MPPNRPSKHPRALNGSHRHPEAARLARELASRTGETLTEAEIGALRERLGRTPAPTLADRAGRVQRIVDEAARIIHGRPVDADDLYYDEGLPTQW